MESVRRLVLCSCVVCLSCISIFVPQSSAQMEDELIQFEDEVVVFEDLAVDYEEVEVDVVDDEFLMLEETAALDEWTTTDEVLEEEEVIGVEESDSISSLPSIEEPPATDCESGLESLVFGSDSLCGIEDSMQFCAEQDDPFMVTYRRSPRFRGFFNRNDHQIYFRFRNYRHYPVTFRVTCYTYKPIWHKPQYCQISGRCLRQGYWEEDWEKYTWTDKAGERKTTWYYTVNGRKLGKASIPADVYNRAVKNVSKPGNAALKMQVEALSTDKEGKVVEESLDVSGVDQENGRHQLDTERTPKMQEN